MASKYMVGCFVMMMVSGCAMSEEMRRINQTKQAEQLRDASRSSNLTGEQLFIRSCNTCHPGGGKSPLGPTLETMAEHFPDDAKLKAFIRKGKGAMPAQPKDTINDKEMDDLVYYLRHLEF